MEFFCAASDYKNRTKMWKFKRWISYFHEKKKLLANGKSCGFLRSMFIFILRFKPGLGLKAVKESLTIMFPKLKEKTL